MFLLSFLQVFEKAIKITRPLGTCRFYKRENSNAFKSEVEETICGGKSGKRLAFIGVFELRAAHRLHPLDTFLFILSRRSAQFNMFLMFFDNGKICR